MVTASIQLMCRWVPAIVFAVSALSKVRGRAAFAGFVASLRPFGFVGARRTVWLAGAIAFAEGTVAAALAVLPWAGCLLAAALAAVFAAGLTSRIRRGIRAECACFGASAQPIGYGHVVRSACLVLFALAGLPGWWGPVGSPDPAAGLLALACGSLVAVLVIRLDDLLDLFFGDIRN
ncbi:MauE/DoxX family redox-associated membrane protein [Amycolatopsis sp. NPDC051102]|uniref:MauE/DoxX family redox-associated membrane protein n=1 Tax=Amycolatopsis sp. NPDC051102 TaxID=3155163 RepID=UPI00341E079F